MKKVSEGKEEDGYNGGMDLKSQNQYPCTFFERYLKAEKEQKGQLLDEYCRNTRQNHKYVILKISRLVFGLPRVKRKRAVVYGPAVREAGSDFIDMPRIRSSSSPAPGPTGRMTKPTPNRITSPMSASR